MFDRIGNAWNRLIEIIGRWLSTGSAMEVALLSVVGTTLIFILFWRVVRYLFGRLATKVASLEGTRLRPLTFQQQELLSASEIGQFTAGTLRWIGHVIVLVGFCLYVQTALGFFPATRRLSDRLFSYAIDAVALVFWSIVGYIPNLLILLVLFFVARGVITLARVFFRGVSTHRIQLPGFYADWGGPTFELVRVLIVVFAAVVMFPYLPGHGSSAFQAIGVFIGVLVSLGSSGAVANIISGIVLTYMRPFKVGDRVKIADAVGDVVEKTTFVTRVRTPKNVEITIPNGMVMSNHIINYSALAREHGLILHASVTIGYDVDWRRVHELLIAAALATENIVAEPPPFVMQTSLDDFNVAYEINARTRDARAMLQTASDLRRNILDKFNEAGVEIMSPHFSAVRDGNPVHLPPDYLPKDYEAPAFRVGPLDWLLKK